TELAVVVVVEYVTVGALSPFDDGGTPRRMQWRALRVVMSRGEEDRGYVDLVEIAYHSAVFVDTDRHRRHPESRDGVAKDVQSVGLHCNRAADDACQQLHRVPDTGADHDGLR